MDISRMYRIMMALIANDKMSRTELAKKAEISERSVQRYITALVESGVPVVSESGKGGGYSIPGEFKLTSTLLTSEDTERIRTCLSALSGTFKDNLTEEVLDKLSALSGCDTSGQLVVDFDNWNGEGASAKEDAMTAAMRNGVSVDMEYADKSGTVSRRLFDPYCIALKEGVRYVYGRCHVHNDFRLFRLARVRSVALTDMAFTRDDRADVHNALMLDGGSVDLEIEFDENARAGVEEWLGSGAVTESDPPRARARVYGGGELVRKILSFGSYVRVLSPARIAELVSSEAAKIAEAYAGA